MLTEEQIEELKGWVNKLEIDVCELPSYHYDSNPYGLEYPLSCGSGQYDWDEDEDTKRKSKKPSTTWNRIAGKLTLTMTKTRRITMN